MSFASVRQYVTRSLVTILAVGIVNLAVPASAHASTASDVISATEVTTNTSLLAPGVLQRAIAVEARRAALQAPQPATGAASGSHMGCRAGAVLLAGAGAAFATAIVKHAQWTGSGATTTPGAKPPSSVGVSVGIGAVLAAVGIVALSTGCGE